jgi:Vacuolar protein sorting 55
VLTYILAPVPNWLCSRAATHDDFMDGGGAGVVDLGRFLTGFFVVMGIGEFYLWMIRLFEER